MPIMAEKSVKRWIMIKRFMLPEIECASPPRCASAATSLTTSVIHHMKCVEVVDICLHTVAADCTVPTAKCNSMLA
jgi:hypothetical protein